MAGKANYGAAADRSKKPPREVAAPRVRTEPIRVTLDLKPTLHTKLKKWCNLTAAERDLPEVAMAPVLRLL
ncbi:hypothetical protein, partial [Kitasatospora sp. NPDC058478]|uniref:hypothetical protein n=1 Tax=unclassified Kitasatospora TaxID=2633591 RepID=UPI00364A7A12